MARYRIEIVVETEEDPSELLDLACEFAEENGGDANDAQVEDLDA